MGFLLIALTTASWCAFAAYSKALEDAIAVLDKIAMPIDVNDRKLQRDFKLLFFDPNF